MLTTIEQAQDQLASLMPVDVSLHSHIERYAAYCYAVWAPTLSSAFGPRLDWANRGNIIPVFILYPNTNPFKFVIEILIVFINPYPYLLLCIAIKG